jgi:hypothetical protein
MRAGSGASPVRLADDRAAVLACPLRPAFTVGASAGDVSDNRFTVGVRIVRTSAVKMIGV